MMPSKCAVTKELLRRVVDIDRRVSVLEKERAAINADRRWIKRTLANIGMSLEAVRERVEVIAQRSEQTEADVRELLRNGGESMVG